MANMHLVTGYAGQEHVTAADHGAFNAALIGTGQFVLDKGNVFEAQVISNNTVRVLDGELMMQGRFVRLDPGTYVDLTIENGAQGMKRNDLIVARYTKNTSTAVETVDLVVIKGTAAADRPADPSYTEADITNSQAVQNDFPLWRIPLDGLNVGEPVPLFGEPFMDSMRTLPEIRRQVNQIHGEVDAKIASLDEYTKTEVLNNATKAAFGLTDSAVPDDVFTKLVSALFNKEGLVTDVNGNPVGTRIATGSYVGAGGWGSSSPTSLTLDFVPKFVMVTIGEGLKVWSGYPGLSYCFVWFEGNTSFCVGSETNVISRNGKTLTWHLKSISGTTAHHQLDAAGVTYYYFAIG